MFRLLLDVMMTMLIIALIAFLVAVEKGIIQ